MTIITSTEAAKRIGVHPFTAAAYAAERQFSKIGRAYVWTEEDITTAIAYYGREKKKFNGGLRKAKPKAKLASQMVQPRQTRDYAAEIRARNVRGECTSTFSPDVYDPRVLLQQARATAQAARGKNG